MTNNELASIVQLVTPWNLAPPEPGEPTTAGDLAHIAHQFAGAFEAEVVFPEPPEVIGPTGSLLRIFSDIHMQCPPSWYGGYKDARIESAGYGSTILSDLRSGDLVTSTFTARLSDYDLLFRRALASTDRRYLDVDPIPVHMTTRANRAELGKAYLVFLGHLLDLQVVRPLSVDLTLGDFISSRIITDRALHPSRRVGDGFIHTELAAISTAVDYDMPEPIIYGRHRRLRPSAIFAGDPPSQHGFEVDLTDHYLGIWDIGGGEKHVWLVAGHACADIPDVNTVASDGTHTTVIPDEGTSWWIPHYAGWAGIFGAPYVDLHSSSFGNDRRYTLILAAVGSAADIVAWTSGGYPMDPEPDAPVRLMAFVDGIEPNGDGSGECILIGALQYLHWMQNWGARTASTSYQSGAYLTTPELDVAFEDDPIPMIDEDSFTEVAAISEIRFPSDGGSPEVAGLQGACIIGAKPGDIKPIPEWQSDWNRSNFCCSCWDRGSYRIATPHPTLAAKAAAPLITAAYEMRGGTFETTIKRDQHANRTPFQYDKDYPTDRWMSSGLVDAGDSILNYDREIMAETVQLPFTPGIAMATHVAFLRSWLFKHPPIHVAFADTIGPDYLGESLGYKKPGEWVRYNHPLQIGDTPQQERLAWILARHINAGARRVELLCWDMEELIGFDIPATVDPTLNESCETAIEITNGADEAYAITMDTTAHATDAGVAAIAGLPGPAVGYHAAWFAYTPPANGTLFLTTVHSQYDTQLAVNTGACGALTNIEYNDNDGILTTSILEFAVTAAVPLKIVVYGYGPDDGGPMTFGLLFTAA